MNEIYLNGITSANLRQMANVESDDINRGCRAHRSFAVLSYIYIRYQKLHSLVYFIVLYISWSLAFKISKATTTLYQTDAPVI